MARLNNKTAIITGGSGGIGAATAHLFAREGANVLLVDVDETALARVTKSIESSKVAYMVADVSDEKQSQAYVNEAVSRFGGVDILFANAGIEGKMAPIGDATVEDFDRVWQVNVRGVWLGLHYAIPKMTARGGGSIIITSSVAGRVGFATMSPYVTSKHALVGLMQTAALEGASAKIRVNTIHPGPVANRMMDSLERQVAPDAPQTAHAGFEQMVPMGRYGTNEEIARMALFLGSDDSSYCTGGQFVVDGGFVAR